VFNSDQPHDDDYHQQQTHSGDEDEEEEYTSTDNDNVNGIIGVNYTDELQVGSTPVVINVHGHVPKSHSAEIDDEGYYKDTLSNTTDHNNNDGVSQPQLHEPNASTEDACIVLPLGDLETAIAMTLLSRSNDDDRTVQDLNQPGDLRTAVDRFLCSRSRDDSDAGQSAASTQQETASL